MAPASGAATVAAAQEGLNQNTRKNIMKKGNKDRGFLGISGLDRSTRNALYAKAKADGRSLSAFVVRVLRDYVSAEAAK